MRDGSAARPAAGSTTTTSRAAGRSGQIGAPATVALWCGSFALIKHLVDVLRGLEPSRAMSYRYCVPPLAVAIGALALGETVTALLLPGGAVVIGGVALASDSPPERGFYPHDPCVLAAQG